MSLSITHIARSSLAAGFFICALSGCERKEIRTYTAPKDAPPSEEKATTEQPETAPAGAADALPRIGWVLPDGWQEGATDKMSVAAFKMEGATVNVTPLPKLAGQESMLVNMWRQTLGQTPFSDEDAAKALREVTVGDDKGQLFEVTGEQQGRAVRIVTAFLHKGDRSWFFKLQGDPTAVQGQVKAFEGFLKSVRYDAAPATPAAKANAPAAAPKLPAGWVVLEPGPMQMGKFAVPAQGDAKAEVSVSVFPSDTGGAISNVRRWRSQLGLPEVGDAELLAAAKPLDGATEGATLVELQNEGKSLVAAVVPREGRWFFYKLLGDTPAVSAARESFVSFAKTPL